METADDKNSKVISYNSTIIEKNCDCVISFCPKNFNQEHEQLIPLSVHH